MATTLSLGPRRCRALAGVSSEYLLGPLAQGSSKSLDEDSEVPSVHGFLVGTTVLGGENDIITLQYQEEEKKLSQIDTRPHSPGEIWELAPHPKENIVIACWASTSEGRGLSFTKEETLVNNLQGGEGARSAAFEQKTGGEKFASVHDDGTVKQWAFREGDLTPTVETAIVATSRSRGAKDIAWDPNHSGMLIGATGGRAARIFDFRESREVSTIETGTRCLTVDVNPNRPHFFLTAGEDALLKFWDARKANEPVQVLRDGHQHWIEKARYNPFHDQLVISSSTCGSVCLWRATSVSSAPLLDLDSDEDDDIKLENRKQQADSLVKGFDENLDSVYGLAWSRVNAWIFASLSYDGKVVMHSVPSGEKYKILL